MKVSKRDECVWLNGNLRCKEDENPNKLEMHISEEDDEDMMKIKNDFNDSHTNILDVVEDAEVANYYNCDLILQPFGSNKLPKGVTPSETSGYVTEVKFKIKYVLLYEERENVAGSIIQKKNIVF